MALGGALQNCVSPTLLLFLKPRKNSDGSLSHRIQIQGAYLGPQGIPAITSDSFRPSSIFDYFRTTDRVSEALAPRATASDQVTYN